MEFLKDIGKFFTSIWSSYITFMAKIFGHNLAIGITVVVGFIILSLIFLRVTKK
jgi:hypothetical protein